MRSQSIFATLLLVLAAPSVHAEAYNQPKVHLDPALRLYDSASVTQAANLPDGGVVLVGDFDEYAGVRVDGIVKLSSSGVVDQSFRPNLKDESGKASLAQAVVVVGPHLYISGPFATVDTIEQPYFARFHLPELQLDQEWTPPDQPHAGASYPMPMAELDGDLVICTTRRVGSSIYVNHLMRLDVSGNGDGFGISDDTSLGSGFVMELKATPDGNIALLKYGNIGVRSGATGEPLFSIDLGDIYRTSSRLDLDIASNGDLLIAGDFHYSAESGEAGLRRYNGENGSIVPGWNFTSNDPDASFGTVIGTNDGGAIVTGSFTNINGTPTASGIARIDSSGAIQPNWGGAHASNDTTFAHRIDESSFLMAESPRDGSPSNVSAARFVDGQSNANTFQPAQFSDDATVSRIERSGTSFFVSGDFSRSGQRNIVGILKISDDLVVDNLFSPSYPRFRSQPSIRTFGVGGGHILAVTDQVIPQDLSTSFDWTRQHFLMSSNSGTDIEAGDELHLVRPVANPAYNPEDGRFYLITGVTSSTYPGNFFRFDPVTTSIDPAWTDIFLFQRQYLRSSLVSNGVYNAFGNDLSPRLVMYRESLANPEPGTRSTWDPGLGPIEFVVVTAAKVDQNNEWIYVAGLFSGRGNIIRISSLSGIVDPAWLMPELSPAPVTALDITDDGTIYLAGQFSSLACDPDHSPNIVRWKNGAVDPTWHVDTDLDAGVSSIIAASGGQMLVGGRFQTINGVLSPGFAVVDGTTDVIFMDQIGDAMCIP